MSNVEVTDNISLEKTLRFRLVLLSTIGALFVVFIVWASVFKIDERVKAFGQVVPQSEIQTVQSLEGGILQDLLVTEGDLVKKGEILARISDVRFASSQEEASIQIERLKLNRIRLQAEANQTAPQWPAVEDSTIQSILANEKEQYTARQKELDNALAIIKGRLESKKSALSEAKARIDKLKENIRLTEKEAVITRELVANNAMPEIEEIKLDRRLNELRGQLKETEERIASITSDVSVIQKEYDDQMDRFKSTVLKELGEVETTIAQLETSLENIGDKVSRTELRAPVTGIVNRVALKTIGGVVEPAMRFMDIVPTGEDLKIIAKVAPNDIAFIKIDQPVLVTISAYDPIRFGRLSGRLARIGATSVVDQSGQMFFEIEVKTDKTHLGTTARPLPITPGMVATVDVITGRRSLMTYILKPFIRARNEAFTEP